MTQRLQPQSQERLAVIDLGSNSFRLVVFMASGGWWRRTDEIYEPVRIGEGLAASGRLGEEPMRRALATLDVFDHFCRAAGLLADRRSSRSPIGEEVDAVATSAIRDAENSEGFLALAREHTSLPIRVLSREEEARYGYLAAVNSTTLTDGCVLDLGGGSLQLVRVVDRLAHELGSWPLGAVRMTERFLPVNGPAKRRQIDELREHVARELQQADWLARTGRRLVGIGGTVRNLATAVQRASGLPSNGVQAMIVSAEALADLVERLAALPASERSSVPGIKPARADLILAGAIVVQGALLAGGFDGLEVTEAGLREGVFFERLLAGSGMRPEGVSPGSADRDPPLFADLRRTSVLNLAAQYRPDLAHTDHVAMLALAMFDELARLGLHDGDPIERELLWAASMLHDIGMSVDYDDHHKHSRYLILNGGLPGYSPAEVAIVAQAVRYHRKGMPDPGPLAALFGPEDLARLDRCAVLLRLAEDLERSRDQLVRGTRFTLMDSPGAENGRGADGGEKERDRNGAVEEPVANGVRGQIELRLIADGESAVPRWAASREGELFARAFHRELLVAA
ncbi:MAG: HD domain-containing protein [Solirubrobacteraceae bacterium]|jgi:exopolyphosphatase/guanosine-5'-triphosphate,3'-diphosphate pyrophosphatase